MIFGGKISSPKNGMTRKFNIIGSLLVVLPILILAYTIQRNDILLDYTQLILFVVVLILILAGLSILRYVFDSVRLMVDFIKKADTGSDAISAAIEKDVSDLGKLSTMFANLMDRFEKSAEELNQRIIELNAVKDMTEVAKQTLDVDELLKLVLDKAMEVVRVKNGSVILVDASLPEGLRFVAARPEAPIKDTDGEVRDYTVIRSVISDGKPLIIQDIENDPRTRKANDPKYGAPSFLSMPIYAQRKVIAVISLANKAKGGIFSESDERILSIMLGEIGFALENAVLHMKVKEQLAEITAQNTKMEEKAREREKITEDMKKINEELQESNANLTKAYGWMRNNRDQLRKHRFKEEIGFLVDRDGVIRSITERALECTGKSRTDLIGAPFTTLLDETSQDEFKNELRQAWMGITRNINMTMNAPYESEKSFEATLTRFTADAKRDILVILR
jgi:two-component system cell cycle sensor histidine kinase/response regulator CckA